MHSTDVLCSVVSSCLKTLSYFMELHADVHLAKASVQQPGESEP